MSIYLDNAATTAVLPEAAQTACDVMTNLYANAASLHSFGFEAEKREAIILPCSGILKQNAEDG